MILSPKKTKYKKSHRGRMKGTAVRGNNLTFGDFGLKAMAPGWITSRQIEAVRRTISRFTKRKGKLWIKIFPDKSVTIRPAESRMGAGKGSVDFWVSVIKPELILFEISGISMEDAKKVLKLASYKLPIKTKFISK